MSPVTRMSVALLLADELRRARDDLDRHDLHVRLGRIEKDDTWRAETVDLITELESTVGRLTRFTREATT